MTELIEKWEEFKLTEYYKSALHASELGSIGMGYMVSQTDMFMAFMEWLGDNQE